MDTDGNCPPKLQKYEGLCIKERVNNNWISTKSAKIRGFMHEGAGGQYTVNPLYLANLVF